MNRSSPETINSSSILKTPFRPRDSSSKPTKTRIKLRLTKGSWARRTKTITIIKKRRIYHYCRAAANIIFTK
jgi:hypothetical protein